MKALASLLILLAAPVATPVAPNPAREGALVASPPDILGMASGDLDGDGKPDSAALIRDGEGIHLRVKASGGADEDRVIGEIPLTFLLDGKAASLAIEDVNGDGRPEVLCAAGAADRGLLYVFQWSAKDAADPLVSLYADSDAFVSETGAFPDALAVDSHTKRVVVAGRTYAPEGPGEALFTFEWKGGAYQLAKTEPAAD
jgi:hypothetical protein